MCCQYLVCTGDQALLGPGALVRPLVRVVQRLVTPWGLCQVMVMAGDGR